MELCIFPLFLFNITGFFRELLGRLLRFGALPVGYILIGGFCDNILIYLLY